MPGPARPVHLYSLVDPSPGRSRGQVHQRSDVVLRRVSIYRRGGALVKLLRLPHEAFADGQHRVDWVYAGARGQSAASGLGCVFSSLAKDGAGRLSPRSR